MRLNVNIYKRRQQTGRFFNHIIQTQIHTHNNTAIIQFLRKPSNLTNEDRVSFGSSSARTQQGMPSSRSRYQRTLRKAI